MIAAMSFPGNSEREAAIDEMIWKIRKLQNEARSRHPGKNIVANITPSPDDDIDLFREAMRRIEAEDGRDRVPNISTRLRETKIEARQKVNPGSTRMLAPSKPFAIASAVNTLAALKALPLPDQAMLLLRKLINLAVQMKGTGGLHQGNLMLPNDSSGLAAGFPSTENMLVRQHLLGVPWTRLVNEGFLVDPAGSGFFSVSEEGHTAAKNAENPNPRLDGKLVDADVPTAFISYSWDSPEHKDWVLRLAERLREEGGVQVVLDRWHLGPGADRTHFMEESVRTSDFVLIVCTPPYAAKANRREGGVGYEAMIITTRLAQRIQQNKYIPVLRAGGWDDRSVPIWIQSKIGVDLRGDPYKQGQYEDLLRALHREPLKPPPVGPKPRFVKRSSAIAGNAVDAVRQSTSGKP